MGLFHIAVYWWAIIVFVKDSVLVLFTYKAASTKGVKNQHFKAQV